MVPFIVAAAAVSLGATALAFLLDRETEEEKEQHKELRRRNHNLRGQFESAHSSQGRELAGRRAELARRLARNRAEACREFQLRVDVPRQELVVLTASLRADLSDSSISPYRRNALRLLQGRLEDTSNRLKAFLDYCDWYLKQQDWLADRKCFEELIEFPDPASRLPEDWYYDGKVGLASVMELSDQYNDYGQKLSLQTYKQGDHYSDAFQRALMLQYPDQDAIPVQLRAGKNPRYFQACILRGALYVEHILERLPCLAIVSQFRPNARLGDGYQVRCFPGFCSVDSRQGQDGGVRAFLPCSEATFPGKRYLPGEKIEVLLHHHDLLLKSDDLTVTQQGESLALGGRSSAPVFLYADSLQHDLYPVLQEAAAGATWQLRACREEPQALSITLQLGAWQIETEANLGDSQLRVTALNRSGVDSVLLDQLPFSLRLIEERFSDSVYCDLQRFHEFTQFCRQQALFGDDEDARRMSGQFFERWSHVIDYLLEESGYQTFHLSPMAEPQDREWDFACEQKLRDGIQRLTDNARFPVRLYIEELSINNAGERWLQIGVLKGVPEALQAGVFRLSHSGIRRPRPEQGFWPAHPAQLRLRIPDGGELANLGRQKRALQAFMSGRLLNRALQQILLMPSRYSAQPDPVWCQRVKAGLSWQDPNWIDPAAANHTKRIIEAALTESNLYLIQGPPGTGKTTCIVELLYQIYAANPSARVLVVSQQNTAVDNALTRFLKRYPDYAKDLLRISSDATKVDTGLHPQMTETVLSNYLVERQQGYSRAAGLGQSAHADLIKDWIESVYRDGSNGKPQFDDELTELLVGDYKLIGATCVGLASRRHGMDRLVFDVCIVDEGGRSTVPELLIPLMRSRKAIIIGDHFQLPPSVASQLREADAKETLPFLEETFLKTSFFEQLYENLPPACRGRLQEQFRMVEPIGDLVADLFYTNQGERGLFNGKTHDRTKFLDPQHPLRWHDVQFGRQEKENGVGPSLVNVEEAEAICHYLTVAANALVADRGRWSQDALKKTVAIITPYGAQKRLIDRLLDRIAADGGQIAKVLDIEVDTVDGFQGSEADIVLYSTVRTRGNISFLLDRQRLNVACSRARENLVFFGSVRFLGECETRCGLPLFSRIFERAKISTSAIGQSGGTARPSKDLGRTRQPHKEIAPSKQGHGLDVR